MFWDETLVGFGFTDRSFWVLSPSVLRLRIAGFSTGLSDIETKALTGKEGKWKGIGKEVECGE